MASYLVYGLFDEEGECLDTCKATCESEAWDWFADLWDVNNKGLYVDYFEPDLDDY